MLAAVRFDFGNIYPNNILYNTSIVDETLFPSQNVFNPQGDRSHPLLIHDTVRYRVSPNGDAFSALSEYWASQLRSSAKINIPFLCHYMETKTPATAFISILVSITSLMTTFWALVAFLMAFFATYDAPECELDRLRTTIC